jgi:hypothetical protein
MYSSGNIAEITLNKIKKMVKYNDQKSTISPHMVEQILSRIRFII